MRIAIVKLETIRKLIGAEPSGKAPSRPISKPQPPLSNARLIAIGASAGGPVALARIISYLPANFCTPIVIVQHVDPQFAPGLANWLDNQTPLRVRLAQEGDAPCPGTILLAGRDQHLVLTLSHRLDYVAEPLDCSYRPSVDVFFKSIRRHWIGEVLGVLLTGMGRDGAQGLLQMRSAGSQTIAQDEASSVVWGMPGEAVALGAAQLVVPLSAMAAKLVALVAAMDITRTSRSA